MNKYYVVAITASLASGLTLSACPDEEKREVASSEKVEKQGGEERSRSNIRTSQSYIRAINSGISHLNGLEALAWGNKSMETGGYTDDASVFKNVKQTLGNDYSFTGSVSGGHITYKGLKKVALKRTSSSARSPGGWEMVSEKQELKELEQLLSLMEVSEKEKFSKLATSLKPRPIDAAISELNGREALAWGDQSLKPEGFTDDSTIFKALDLEIGNHYSFKSTVSGGHISYKAEEKVILKRTPSSATSPGIWKRASEE